jgi:predicted RNA-binding Zn-ribbon protein involved in translation (DUF1610 family)
MKIILSKIWEQGYSWFDKDGNKIIFNPNKNLLNHPHFIDYNQFNIKTTLSARALCSLTTQLCGILGASVEKQRKRLFILEKIKKEGLVPSKAFIRSLRRGMPKKPNVENINAELSSKCCDIKFVEGRFNAFIQLKSIGDSFGKVRIPIKYTKHSKNLKENSTLKGSFLFKNHSIDFRWESEVDGVDEGIEVGADQGKNDILVLSNGEKTPTEDNDKWTLDKILQKLSRKKKGSKAFRKAQAHRENYVNWSINQLNFQGIKELRLEKIWNINYGKNTSRIMKHWSNVLIRDKVKSICETLGVHVVEQSCVYRSQRCSNCGLVRKANRKGKIYHCKSCGFVCDADLNAARNHEQNLPNLPFNLRKQRFNLGHGFYWKADGLFFIDGTALRVPYATEVNCL